MSEIIKIAIADDHQIVIDGLRHMLEAQAGIEIVGEACHGGELVALLSEKHADVVLLDIDMPVMNGIATCKAIAKDYSQSSKPSLEFVDIRQVWRGMSPEV